MKRRALLGFAFRTKIYNRSGCLLDFIELGILGELCC